MVRPIAIGVKMEIIMIQGSGLLISPFPTPLIFTNALKIRKAMAIGPIIIHSIPKYFFNTFMQIFF
jgi:hypothetical protein